MNNKLPFLPTRDLVIFPGVVTPVYVGRDKSIKTLERVMDNEDSKMLFGMQKDSLVENPELPKDVYDIGVIVNILQTVKMPNNTIKLLVEAENRVTIINPREVDGEYEAEYSVIECVNTENKETTAVYRKVLEYFERYSKLGGKVLPELLINLKSTKDINGALDIIANNLYIDNQEKQRILESFDTKERGYLILDILSKEIEINEIEKKVEDKVRNKMNEAQKAYYIREKINAMKDEIHDYTPEEENSDLKEKIEKAKLPAEVKKKIDEELKKMSKMPAFSAEASVSRNYIDVLLDLPWKKMTKDILDIEKAAEILDRDHYGLKEVKDRILDYLAVKQLNPKMRGTIICLVGPPGVGKTSIAKSIAEAMGRKFVRVSLGGVRDEAEIRGHRRTYIGSMPGRIMKAMKLAGTKNPFILLDELDKMASDFKGDPASAMLEVLDPEQNIHFEDHYVDVPFDLSEVFFLGTANDLRNIPGPLIDRMEIIHLSSYTEYEKLHIAQKYLIKQIQEENGLKDIKISISDKVILKIINEYTREAGVRNLKREINSLYRKIARKVVKEKVDKLTINVNNLEKYLGKPKFRPEKLKEREYKVGIVNGLAWTSVGGVTLEVQGVLIPGKGQLSLTGTLGNVMKESGEVAFTYVKSNFKKYNIDEKDFLENKNIHLHFPEGATPKDGPSAGITITTAILSVLTGREIRQDIAMTGEITITGEVLAIGGVKEKVIGAYRAGIREVILPEDNRVDADEIPAEVKKDITIHYAKTYDDVEKLVFKQD
ncbi:MAG: endopeptidase La [Fusobacterium perfoetens]|uniref:endopeptidase La n=1 Tax=Fusobacterium perfoetens TaxID=852 RepID=UPI0023F0A57B|nr:endopeptidase La [Fusobacterium perfoetens]MCI6152786.1 endopeptidase La [Fusobacterium perfoetens]MDY3236680.1 endopeptidase La [Fusobacterium perfoetens]